MRLKRTSSMPAKSAMRPRFSSSESAAMAPACASPSTMRTPGITGRPGADRLLPADAPEGAVAVADEQEQGRGRLGRVWTAPPGTGLLLSVVLRPRVEPTRLPTLTIAAAHALCDVVGQLGLAAAVKE